MTDRDWTDRIVGARMTVDGEFADRVKASGFSRQEWGLLMTAVEFEIETPDDPPNARLVANSENMDAVLPEVQRAAEMERQAKRGGSDGGVLDTIRGALGLNNGSDTVDEERLTEAKRLTQEYATELQQYLHDQGRWEEVCAAAAGELGPSGGGGSDTESE